MNFPLGVLSDLATIEMGQSPRGETVSREPVGLPLLNGPTEFGPEHPDPVQWTQDGVRFAQRGDVLFCVRGSTTGRMNLADRRYAIGRGIAALRAKSASDSRIVKYALHATLADLLAGVSGSVFPNLSRDQILRHAIPVPPAEAQQAIAEVLGALDDKIAANTALVSRLQEMAEALVASTPTTEAFLSEYGEFHNRRRVPLSAAQREARRGVVLYYGANGAMATVDEPIFNEPLVLLGEDGSVVRDDGSPYVHYVWGPAWVNNHAHVITGVGVSTELLATMLSAAKVDTLVTGAVQPKLSMGNAKRIRLRVPDAAHRAVVDGQVSALAASKRVLSEESRTLAATRDALLPQLMSGKLRVRDAERIASEVGA